MNLDALGLWLGRGIMAGFAALVVVELIRYFRSALADPIEPRTPNGAPLPGPRVWGEALLAFAASRLLVVLVILACHRIRAGTFEGFSPVFASKLTPWDADHYLGIIESWYVAEGDPRLHIVFLPFYPAVARTLYLLTGMSSFSAAEIVSNAAFIGCGWAMFRLGEDEGGATLGRRAMWLMALTPMTYFYSIPYTESTFLLMTLLAVLCARRRRFVPAVVFGAMAANARIVGMAVAIPIYWELLRHDRELHPSRKAASRAAICAAKVLPVAAGLALYMYGNWRLFGNPAQFMVFQRQHWSQKMGTLSNTFRYCMVNALTYGDGLYRLGVWWPQTLLLVALPLLVLWRRKRECPGDTGYLLAFFYVSFVPTWLLSGARYLSAAYALYPLLARIPRDKKGFGLLLAGECALLIYMTVVGLWFGKVY